MYGPRERIRAGAGFFKREHGGMLLENGTIDRWPVVKRGKDFIAFDPSEIKSGTWGYYHAHYGESGTPAPNGGFWLAHHSPDDFTGTLSNNLQSIVINPTDIYYKAPNVSNVDGLIHHNIGFQRSFTFPFLGFW